MFHFFDFITQDRIQIQPEVPCILYLIKASDIDNTYYLRALSTGIEYLNRDPLFDTNFYWPINNINDFITKISNEGLNETIFPEGELTSAPLTVATLIRLGITTPSHETRQVFKPEDTPSLNPRRVRYTRPRDYQLHMHTRTAQVTYTQVTERILVNNSSSLRTMIRENANDFSSEQLQEEVRSSPPTRTLSSRLFTFFHPQRPVQVYPNNTYFESLSEQHSLVHIGNFETTLEDPNDIEDPEGLPPIIRNSQRN